MKVRRGFHSYLAIVTHLHGASALTAEVATSIGYEPTKANQLLNELRTLRIVRRERENTGLRGTTFRWFLGPDKSTETQRKPAAHPRATAIQFAIFFRALARPVTVKALARAMGTQAASVYGHLKIAREEFGAVAIVGYDAPNRLPRRYPEALFAFAPGQPDVTYRPPPVAQVSREARQRARLRADRLARQQRLAANSSIFAMAAAMAA